MMHKNYITPQTMGDPIFMFFSSLGIKRERWTEEEERELAQAFSRQQHSHRNVHGDAFLITS